jgi:hypothetical protein
MQSFPTLPSFAKRKISRHSEVMSQQLSPISANGGGKSSRPNTANAKEDKSRGEIKKERKEVRNSSSPPHPSILVT